MDKISLNILDKWKLTEQKDIEYQFIYLEESLTKISTTDFYKNKTLAEQFILPNCFAYDKNTSSLLFTSRTKNCRIDSSEPPFVSRWDQPLCNELRSYIYSISLSKSEAEEIIVAPNGYHFGDMFKLSPDGKRLISLLISDKSDTKSDCYLACLNLQTKRLSTFHLENIGNIQLEDVRFNPDYILITSDMNRIMLIDSEGTMIQSLVFRSPIWGTRLHPSTNLVAFANADGIGLWDINSNSVNMLLPQGCSPVWSPDGEYLWFYVVKDPSHKSDTFRLAQDNSLFFYCDNDGPTELSPWVCFYHSSYISFVDCAPVLCRLNMKTMEYEKVFMINDDYDSSLATAYFHQDGQQYGYDTYEILFTPCGRYVLCPISKWLSDNPRTPQPLNGFFCFLDTIERVIWTSPFNIMYMKEKNAWVQKEIEKS